MIRTSHILSNLTYLRFPGIAGILIKSAMLLLVLAMLSCKEGDEPDALIECSTFDVGRNAVLDAEESDQKCVYGVANYNLISDLSGEDGESIYFKLNGDFSVTFTTYESYYNDENMWVNESNGIFEVGMEYHGDARTGNATFFSDAKLEITSIDRVNRLITGKITSQAPIRWESATPVMGYAIFIFTDLKI
ncbi:MAG: hypothetical protein RIC35_09495 [Marinoscillum sp.]